MSFLATTKIELSGMAFSSPIISHQAVSRYTSIRASKPAGVSGMTLQAWGEVRARGEFPINDKARDPSGTSRAPLAARAAASKFARLPFDHAESA